MDNPKTASNPEIDKVVQLAVSEFQDNHGADAVNQINTEYNNHRNDPTFTKQFTQELTQELEKKNLLPQVSEQLFGTADQMKLIDLDQDGSFSRSEALRIKSSKTLSGTLTPLQQQMVGYLMLNADKIDKSGSDDPTITLENLKDYADHAQDRALELKIADQILKDPQKFHDQFTSNPEITKADLQRKVDTTGDQIKMLSGEDDPATAKTKADLQETKDMAAYLLQHRSEVAIGNHFFNDFTKEQMTQWAQNAKKMDTERVPNAPLTLPDAAKPGSIDGGKSGYTSDLIAEYAKTHMRDMSLSGVTSSYQYGDAQCITKEDIEHYRQLRKDSLTPFENKILDEMNKRYDQIVSASGEYGYGITAADLDAYAKQQAEQRTTAQAELPKGAPSDQDLAIKAGAYFSDPANFNQFSKKNNGKVRVDDLQQQIDETDQLISGGGVSAKTLEHLKQRSQMEHFVQQQMKDHDYSSATLDQVYTWINELGGDYLDASGNKSSPELVATAAAAPPKQDTSTQAGGGDQPSPNPTTQPGDQPNPNPSPQPGDQPNPSPNPQPGDQQPVPKDDHRKPADQTPQLDRYHQYIKDHITDKGGFTPENYASALAQAQASGKEIVLVVGSKDHPDMMHAAAKGIDKNNAVYVYVDKDSIDPNSALGKYVSQVMPGDRTGAIGYNVTLTDGGHLQPGPAHLEVLNTKTPAAAQPGDTPQPQPSPQPGDQPQPSPNPQPGDQPQPNPQPGDQPVQNPNPQDQSSAWNQYINDNITAKGGYTADHYRDALSEASRTGKEVIIVFGNSNNPAMLEGAANGVLRHDAVYVYADTNGLNPNSSLGKLAQLSLQGRQSGAIGFHVRYENDGRYHREQYHPIVFTGAHHEHIYQYNTQPEAYMSAQSAQ